MNVLRKIGLRAVQPDPQFLRGLLILTLICLLPIASPLRAAPPEIDEMIDPAANPDYAARFLKALHGVFGDWSKAAGAYPSRMPSYAERYAARFDRICGKLPAVSTMAAQPVKRCKQTAIRPLPLASLHNPTPLFAQRTTSRGSLAPLVASGATIPSSCSNKRPNNCPS